jgi:hypothetical protein
MVDVNRVQLHNPAADSGVIDVPESEVDRFLDAGWQRVGSGGASGGRRRADTGSTPIQSEGRASRRLPDSH